MSTGSRSAWRSGITAIAAGLFVAGTALTGGIAVSPTPVQAADGCTCDADCLFGSCVCAGSTSCTCFCDAFIEPDCSCE